MCVSITRNSPRNKKTPALLPVQNTCLVLGSQSKPKNAQWRGVGGGWICADWLYGGQEVTLFIHLMSFLIQLQHYALYKQLTENSNHLVI